MFKLEKKDKCIVIKLGLLFNNYVIELKSELFVTIPSDRDAKEIVIVPKFSIGWSPENEPIALHGQQPLSSVDSIVIKNGNFLCGHLMSCNNHYRNGIA